MLRTLVLLVLGVYAAFLSWQCNTAQGVALPLKAAFAAAAGLLSLGYLPLYFLYLHGQTCPGVSANPFLPLLASMGAVTPLSPQVM